MLAFHTPRPIHRSKSFWLGILVIAFLAWAWRDSTHLSTVVRYQGYSISHAGSGICLSNWKWAYRNPVWFRQQIPGYRKEWSRPGFATPEFFRATGNVKQLAYYVRDFDTPGFRPRNSAAAHFVGMITSQIPGAWGLFLPHWLIIVSFLIPWTALLLWRSRRIRHLTKATP